MSEQLTPGEIRARATSAAGLLGVRAIAVYVLGIGANLLLASLLVPRDFGLFAAGNVAVALGMYVAYGGLGAALIRREKPPTPLELEALLGLQLLLMSVVVIAALTVGLAFGRDGLVVATMIASLPLVVLRTPSVVILEQRLEYRPVATGELIEAVVYYAWSCGTVLAGWGVWGLATGVVARALAGSIAITMLGPVGWPRPRWSWSTVRPVFGFGAKFQGAEALYIAREQGLNIVVGAVSGLGTLGIWTLAWRVMQIPNLFFQTVGRVAFSAMSRLVGGGQDVRPTIERAVAVLAAITAMIVAGLVGLAVALPAVVGNDWADVPAVILWSGFGLIASAPIAFATRGYLFVRDQAGAIAMGLVASGALWFGVSAALLPEYGAPAVGVGWVLAGILNSLVLWRRTAELSGAAVLAHAAVPTAVAVAATAAAWFAAHQPDDRLVGGLVGFATGEACVLVGLLVLTPRALRETVRLLRQSLGGLRAA
jgi:O-antigen/teichoic acid export membrane protein